MPKLFDRVKINTSTTGTGDVTFGSVASNAFYTPTEAGCADGDTVRYVIVDGTDVEEGIGTIKTGVTAMERTTVTKSKISGTAGTTKLDLSGTAVLALIASAADILNPANNLSDLADADAALDNLGGTTVGKEVFTATDAAAARTAIGVAIAYFPPQGRLTLSSSVPVMTNTVSSATTLYYTPYVGNMVPLYDGTNMVPTAFSQISVATTNTTKNPAAIGASKVNDWFVWNDSGTLRLTHGPDWTDDVTRSAGSALVMVDGILLNNASITNGPAASRGTWVGTTRSDASSQLDYNFGGNAAGGASAFFGVWNAYNRVLVSAQITDSTTTWTYGTSTWRSANNSTGMRVSFVTGATEDFFDAVYSGLCNTTTTTSAAFGIGYNSTSAFAGTTGVASASTTSTTQVSTLAFATVQPFGFGYLQALEYRVSGTVTLIGTAGTAYMQTGLTVNLRM